MYDYDIVFIKGNPNSGLEQQHIEINTSIVELMKPYTYTIIDSEKKSIKGTNKIPKARVYIGFSRGSRYLGKLNKNSLKLSMGGESLVLTYITSLILRIKSYQVI